MRNRELIHYRLWYLDLVPEWSIMLQGSYSPGFRTVWRYVDAIGRTQMRARVFEMKRTREVHVERVCKEAR